jgi:hypothetical protein
MANNDNKLPEKIREANRQIDLIIAGFRIILIHPE